MNRLYYGDNLDVLRAHLADRSVDLVYLDPPFNSNAGYNVLFKSKTDNGADAQIKTSEGHHLALIAGTWALNWLYRSSPSSAAKAAIRLEETLREEP